MCFEGSRSQCEYRNDHGHCLASNLLTKGSSKLSTACPWPSSHKRNLLGHLEEKRWALHLWADALEQIVLELEVGVDYGSM